MSWIEAVADYLQDQSQGTKGSTLFIGMMPDTSTTTILLTEYSGTITDTYKSGIALYRPQLQVRVRGPKENYTSPHNKILAVQTLLASLGDQTLGGFHFLRFQPTGTVLSLGQDNNLRFEFSCNFEVTYE